MHTSHNPLTHLTEAGLDVASDMADNYDGRIHFNFTNFDRYPLAAAALVAYLTAGSDTPAGTLLNTSGEEKGDPYIDHPQQMLAEIENLLEVKQETLFNENTGTIFFSGPDLDTVVIGDAEDYFYTYLAQSLVTPLIKPLRGALARLNITTEDQVRGLLHENQN